MIMMDDTIRAIWYISLTANQDWLLGLHEEEDQFVFHYRFRYYSSDDPFDKNDKKNWYSGRIQKNHKNGTLPNVVKHMRELFALLEEKTGEKGYELIRGEGDFDTFLEEFKTLPFVHMSEPMNKEQYEEYAKTGDMPVGESKT